MNLPLCMYVLQVVVYGSSVNVNEIWPFKDIYTDYFGSLMPCPDINS